MVLKTRFLSKSSNFCTLLTILILIQISPACGSNVWRYFRFQVSAFANAARKSFNGKYTANIDCQKEKFMFITDANADIGSLKSLHKVFGNYLNHMLVKCEQNRMVLNIPNFSILNLKPFWRKS